MEPAKAKSFEEIMEGAADDFQRLREATEKQARAFSAVEAATKKRKKAVADETAARKRQKEADTEKVAAVKQANYVRNMAKAQLVLQVGSMENGKALVALVRGLSDDEIISDDAVNRLKQLWEEQNDKEEEEEEEETVPSVILSKCTK